MMRGRNTLLLNQATMTEAVQEYFDRRIDPKIKVKSVARDEQNGGPYGAGVPPAYGAAQSFRVEVDEIEVPA